MRSRQVEKHYKETCVDVCQKCADLEDMKGRISWCHMVRNAITTICIFAFTITSQKNLKKAVFSLTDWSVKRS